MQVRGATDLREAVSVLAAVTRRRPKYHSVLTASTYEQCRTASEWRRTSARGVNVSTSSRAAPAGPDKRTTTARNA